MSGADYKHTDRLADSAIQRNIDDIHSTDCSSPATIGPDGRLSVLRPEKVLIQSALGQQSIREKHDAVMEFMNRYPVLRKHLFTDAWARSYLDKWKDAPGTLADHCFPCFYVEPYEVENASHLHDWLIRAEKAIDFLVRKAPRANRNDLLGNIRNGVSSSGEFEVMIAWALISHFEEDAVCPYPRIGTEGKQNVDFSVTDEKENRILIEATVLLDSLENRQKMRNAIKQGIYGTIDFSSDEKDISRLASASLDKINQRYVNDPLVLCTNQLAPWPHPDDGARVMKYLFNQVSMTSDSKLAGIAYFTGGHFSSFISDEQRAQHIGAAPGLLRDIQAALSLLSSKSL